MSPNKVNIRILRILTSNSFKGNTPSVHLHILLEIQCGFSGNSEDVCIEESSWLSTHRPPAALPEVLQVALGLARIRAVPRSRAPILQAVQLQGGGESFWTTVLPVLVAHPCQRPCGWNARVSVHPGGGT